MPPPFGIIGIGEHPAHRQEGVNQQGQGDVAVLSDPAPHFVFVQARLLFGFFEGIFDDPAVTRHPHQLARVVAAGLKQA